MKSGFKKVLNVISLGFKGLFMGAANDIPGVSGGTIAFITGIYQRLIDALSHFDAKAVKLLFTGKGKEFARHIDAGFIVPLFIGMGIGILSLAHLMVKCLHTYPIQTKAFFFGLVLASAVILLKNFNGKKAKDIFWLLLGAMTGVAAALPGIMGHGQGMEYVADWSNTPFGYIFICGVVSICAMILPGISGSLMLQVMGMYEYVMTGISRIVFFDLHAIVVISIFGLGCIIGILFFAKLLHWLLGKWEHPVLVTITGFVLGSLLAVWPWFNYSATPNENDMIQNPHILGALLFFGIGIALIALLELIGLAIRKRSQLNPPDEVPVTIVDTTQTPTI